jgi:hypothetical protein
VVIIETSTEGGVEAIGADLNAVIPGPGGPSYRVAAFVSRVKSSMMTTRDNLALTMIIPSCPRL